MSWNCLIQNAELSLVIIQYVLLTPQLSLIFFFFPPVLKITADKWSKNTIPISQSLKYAEFYNMKFKKFSLSVHGKINSLNTVEKLNLKSATVELSFNVNSGLTLLKLLVTSQNILFEMSVR